MSLMAIVEPVQVAYTKRKGINLGPTLSQIPGFSAPGRSEKWCVINRARDCRGNYWVDWDKGRG